MSPKKAPAIPERAHNMLHVALESGWSIMAQRMTDTGGSPFLSITLVRGEYERINAAWHTRDTGTYRWTGAVVDNQQTGVSIAETMKRIQEEPR